eukprot:1391600-Rhodomonas_salina.1
MWINTLNAPRVQVTVPTTCRFHDFQNAVMYSYQNVREFPLLLEDHLRKGSTNYELQPLVTAIISAYPGNRFRVQRSISQILVVVLVPGYRVLG